MKTVRVWPLLAVALAAPAGGQAVPALPPSSDISRQRVPEPAPVAPTFDLRIENPEKTAVPKAVDEIEFAVSGVAVDGATAFPAAVVDSFFSPLVGKSITLDDLRTAAAKLEARYRSEGYFLSRVFVPPQAIKDGVLRVQVVEGYVSAVFVEGLEGGSRSRLEAALKPLVGKKPVKLSDLESTLLRINDFPGVTATSVLRQGAELGASELVLAADTRPNDYSLSAANTSSKELGPWTFGANAALNRPFDRDGQLSLGIAAGGRSFKEVQSANGRYAMPVGHSGTIASIGALVARARPGGAVAALGIESNVLSVSTRLRLPLIRTRADSLFLDGGLSLNRTRTEALGTVIVRDRSTVGEATLLYQQSGWLQGSTSLSASLFHGFGIFGANGRGTALPSVAGFDPNFTRLALAAQRTQALPNRFSAALSIQAQYTGNNLSSGELISFGGPSIGRGYDPSLVAGDRGIGGVAELRYDPKFKLGTALSGFQLYAFADSARATTLTNGVVPKSTGKLSSLGGGVRVTAFNRGRFDLQFADGRKTVAGNSGRDPRVTLTASLGF